jgi:alpha-L-fucosidase
MGTFFHFTMYTFVSRPNPVKAKHQDCGQVFNADLAAMPHPDVFNPSNATDMVDQWMAASAAMGARYAILVAKHCDGFISFPTNATFADGAPYGYGVQQSSWRGGRGDLARDFVRSARAHGISPGFYYSLIQNFYLAIDGGAPMAATATGQRPATAAEYYDIMLTQLAELWGNYGPLGEIWFDGADPFIGNATLQGLVRDLARRLQPHALLMQGPTAANAGRKGHGETCEVFDPNWYTCPNSTACRSGADVLGGHGPFIPAEGAGCAVGDGDSRQWFWHPDHDEHAALKTVDMFVDEYHKSVGRGSNMLVGLTADRQGAVPDVDAAKITALGDFVRRCYGSPAAVTAAGASLSKPGDFVELAVPEGRGIDRVWLREDITTGQRAQEFRVLASSDGGATFALVGNGTSVARKRIVLLGKELAVDTLRFEVTKALEWPLRITEAAAFATCAPP